MTLAAWVALITAALKFPDAIMGFVNLLKKTPAEKHQDILKAISEEAQKFQDTGRPTWGA